MPTYDYACPTCGTFEVYQSIKDSALKVCPTCGSKKISKLISSGSGVIFSGSGFWETDYNRSKDYATKKKGEAAAPAATTTPAAAAPAAATAPVSPAPASAPKPAGPAKPKI
jgi:putative FmdB family regulatory protein